jgi:hypothetical protein
LRGGLLELGYEEFFAGLADGHQIIHLRAIKLFNDT